MNNHYDVINEITNELLFTLGLGGFLFVLIFGGIIWFFFNQKVNRIEQTFASELKRNRATELDLIYRRREVYGRLIKSMRVFLQKGDPTEKSTAEEKSEFLAAYDEMYIWAPDEVLKAVNDIVKLKRIWAAKKVEAQEANKELGKTDIAALQIKFRELHKICVQKIRQDCGFEETEFDYSYVSF